MGNTDSRRRASTRDPPHRRAGPSVFRYGLFLNALIAFVVIAATLFFLVVRPYTRLNERFVREDPSTKDCPECRSTIPVAATRCAFCTTTL